MPSRFSPAAAGITAAICTLSLAAPAMAVNVYEVDGSGTRGGTTSKPKAATLKASFSIKDGSNASLIPDVVSTYTISIEGGKLDKRVLAKLPKCKVDADGTEQDDSDCSKGSILGGGSLSAAVGQPGNPIQKPSFFCTLPFNIYNTGKDMAIFIRATTKVCPTAVTQWVKQKTTQKGRTVVTSFTVPENLQLVVPPSLFASVTEAQFSLRPKYAKVKGKRLSATQSIGCSDKKRTVTVKFAARSGAVATARKTVKC